MTKFLFTFSVLFVLLLGVSSTLVQSQRELGVRPTDSGGPLMPEQAAYDIKSYDLDLRINPTEQSIKGALTAQALIVHPTAWFVLDLDPPLTVDSVTLMNPTGKPQTLTFERRAGKVWIAFHILNSQARTSVCVSLTVASRESHHVRHGRAVLFGAKLQMVSPGSGSLVRAMALISGSP